MLAHVSDPELSEEIISQLSTFHSQKHVTYLTAVLK